MTISKNIKFHQLAEIWLKKATVGVTYTYKRNLESYIRHLNSFFGDKKILHIKPYDLDEVITQLAECNPNTNKPASKKLLKNVVNCAIRIFDFAVENELICKNPAKNKKKDIPRNAPQKVINPISEAQRQLVVNVEHRAKTAAMIMMFMGLRTGELLALEWSDFDLDKFQVLINKRVQRTQTNVYTVMNGTKNGETRFVSIPQNLRTWIQNQNELATSYLVMPNRQGGLQTPTQWKRLWESYQNEINYFCYVRKCMTENIKPESKYSPNKIPKIASSFNPHQLRHTYATMLYTSGVDVLTASELLGHSNIQITLDIYTQLERKYKQKNISKFNDYIKSNFDIKNINSRLPL